MDNCNHALYLQVANVIHTHPLPTVALVVLSAVFAQNPARSLEHQIDVACSVLIDRAQFHHRFWHRFPPASRDIVARTMTRILLVRAMFLIDEPAALGASERLARHVLDCVAARHMSSLWNDDMANVMCWGTVERLLVERDLIALARRSKTTPTSHRQHQILHQQYQEEDDAVKSSAIMATTITSPSEKQNGDVNHLEELGDDKKCSGGGGVSVCPNSAMIFGSIDV